MICARRLSPLVPIFAAVGCGVADMPSVPVEPARTGTVVIGVMSDLEPGTDIDGLHVTMRARGETTRDDTLWAGGALRFPTELRFEGLPDGTPVDASLEAIDGQAPFLSRLASTRIVAGKTLLLRAWLERACIPSYRLQAGLVTPTCAPPETCISAACEDPFVAPSELEAYTPDWATSFEDACKPLDHGAPEVSIGQGETAYRTLSDGDEMALRKGPQGGLHVWVAVRTRNLHRAGSVTTISAYSPDLGTTFEPVEVGYEYDPARDGSCVLYGLRYVIASQVSMSEQLLGTKLRLDVKVADVAGDVAAHETIVTLAN